MPSTEDVFICVFSALEVFTRMRYINPHLTVTSNICLFCSKINFGDCCTNELEFRICTNSKNIHYKVYKRFQSSFWTTQEATLLTTLNSLCLQGLNLNTLHSTLCASKVLILTHYIVAPTQATWKHLTHLWWRYCSINLAELRYSTESLHPSSTYETDYWHLFSHVSQ